jgi:hypothetical protein
MSLCRCGNRLTSAGRDSRGIKRYKRICHQCRTKKYVIYKKDYCEICGFVPVWLGQLDVDHIDGNKQNNNKENLQTLCANCHRLKTYNNKDFYNKLFNDHKNQLVLFEGLV